MENQKPENSELKTAEFQRPRHWVTLDELKPEYWQDEAAQAKRAQEFHDKPIETLETIEKLDKTGVSRRDFLTVMGASMAMASFACARRPMNKIIPYVVQPQELTPGIPLYYASTYKDGGKSCGIVVKTREGRPIKLEGNPADPISKGALTARAQASILNLYDPERLKAPMKGSKAGSKSGTNWNDVDSVVAAALKEAKHVRIVSYPDSGEATRRIRKEFLAAFADAKWLEVDPLGGDEVADGQNDAYGNRVVPHYAYDQADVVVSFGADFLGTWGCDLEGEALWVKKRKLDKASDNLSKLYVFEAMLSLTGSNADERFAVLPGAEIAAALAVARELIVVQKKGKFAGNSDVTALLNGSMDEWLSKAGGLSAEKVKKVAEDLWAARGKSIVVGNGSAGLQAVVNLLNSNLENEGKTIDGNGDVLPETASTKQLAALMAEMDAGQVDVLIVHHVNPVYFLPNGDAFGAAMQKVKTVIAVNDRVDETANFADIVCAENHFLENWGDAHPKPSVYLLQQPTISPLFDTKSFEDLLISWTRAGVKSNGLLAQVAGNPASTYYDYVKETWKQSLFSAYGKGQTFIDFWELSLQKGVVEGKSSGAHERTFRPNALRVAQKAVTELKSLSLAQAKKGPAIEGSGVALALYSKVSLYDGRDSNNAWLQEMPDPITTITWDNYLNIGPAYAKELDIQRDDVVLVKSGDVSFELPVNVQPGILKGAVTIALGYGRTAAGKVGNNVGQNAFKLAKFNGEEGFKFNNQLVSIVKTGKRYQLAATQEHNRTEERPVLNDITIAQFKKDPTFANETEPKLKLSVVPSMWTPPIDYSKSPYRWMMGIDMNACTGCGACVIACQAENNIPVVGRDRVRVSREMHWIRIDRYYSGDEEQPQVIFQPMLCQHCENAPCETVCPVVATSHNEEGLNQMTYSRCVGTRYCQNNCPYKVRRFNFFDHWKDYKDNMNMVWNPDVTVRSRGIMEKCTFCVQRINGAKDHAKDIAVKNKESGKNDPAAKVRDADLKTACQQTCPTQAIVFGNVNDPSSEINQVKAHPRAFRVLEILNVKPSIHYLAKVRNVEEGHSEEAEHGQHS
jgi:Fe-S-cluster-containing dehydrogenase component/anaerobic selenocysteine-containing dehydrogenase